MLPGPRSRQWQLCRMHQVLLPLICLAPGMKVCCCQSASQPALLPRSGAHLMMSASQDSVMCAGAWYLITGGSKEVLMAWRVSFHMSSSSRANVEACEGSSPAMKLQHTSLATRPPPRTGLRPQSRQQGASSAASEHRVMALAALPVQEQRLPVVVASSSAMLQLLYLDLATKRQVPPASKHHCFRKTVEIGQSELS